MDVFSSLIKSPLKSPGQVLTASAAEEENSDEEIEAYLEWEEEVHAMSNAELKEALIARKLSPFGSARQMQKRLIEAGPEIEVFEVVTSGTVTLPEDIEVEVEETPAPRARRAASRSAVSSHGSPPD